MVCVPKAFAFEFHIYAKVPSMFNVVDGSNTDLLQHDSIKMHDILIL